MKEKTGEEKEYESIKNDEPLFYRCPWCGTGLYGGIFYTSCDNPQCKKYDSFAMRKCRICGMQIRYCSC